MCGVMKDMKMKARFLGKGREGILPGLLYADEQVLCGESKENLSLIIELFTEICKKEV